jgi:phosphoribosylglycinamide formyltransferase 1
MRVVVLLSGTGLTLAALLKAKQTGALKNIEFYAVISDRSEAAGLLVAEQYGIPAFAVDRKLYPSKAGFENALLGAIDSHKPDLVVLAGFMRVLSAGFVGHFADRMINLHPSLLPKFPGLDTHRRALEAGESEHGASVHWVTAELDGGPVIASARTLITPDDDVTSLQARVKRLEQALLIEVLEKLSVQT